MSRRRALAALLLAVLLGAARPPAALAATPDAVAYVQLVDAAVAHLQAAPPEVDAALAAVASARRLAPPPGGLLGLVTADLARVPPDVDDALTRLRAVAAVLALPPGAEPGDDAAARQRLADVYRQPAFAHLDQPPSQSPLAQLFDALRRLVGEATRVLGTNGSLLAGGAVLLAVLALVLRLVHGAGGRRARRAAPQPEVAPLDSEEEWAGAAAAAAAGDFREAVRRAFRSALLSLALQGRLPVDASWTTRELLARAAGDAELVAALTPAAAAFDRAWYSGQAVDEARWREARERCAAVRRVAEGRRLAA